MGIGHRSRFISAIANFTITACAEQPIDFDRHVIYYKYFSYSFLLLLLLLCVVFFSV